MPHGRSAHRRANARLTRAKAVERDGTVGVALCFRPENARLEVDRIEDFAELGPELTVPAVSGIGKVLRLLRAARIATPREPLALVGRHDRAAELLERALGVTLELALRPRFRQRLRVWTESGVVTVDDVAEVHEYGDATLVRRRRDRLPVRFARESIVRQQMERERWFEVVGIEPVR